MADHRLKTVLITGASSGIGAAYAERFARRGHDLVLVARDRGRMEAASARLSSETGVAIDVLSADLTERAERAAVEARLRDDRRIGVLVNNAGAASMKAFAASDPDEMERLILLNVIAATRLAGAVAPRFVAEGRGAIVNISSVVALAPELMPGVYAATKSYMLTLSQSLQVELGPQGVYVQAVLPTSTRTEIFERSGLSTDSIPVLMDVGELVDAALVGFDRREAITIPPLPELGQWEDFAAARKAMLPNFRQGHAAARYRA